MICFVLFAIVSVVDAGCGARLARCRCHDSFDSKHLGFVSSYGKVLKVKWEWQHVASITCAKHGLESCHTNPVEFEFGLTHTDSTTESITGTVIDKMATAAATLSHTSSNSFTKKVKFSVSIDKCLPGWKCEQKCKNFHVEYQWCWIPSFGHDPQCDCTGHQYFLDHTSCQDFTTKIKSLANHTEVMALV